MIHLIKYLLVISFSVATVAQTQPASYLGYACSNKTTFVRNSTYQTNLNNLLSSLSSNANNSLGFYSTSSGRHSDAVHGLFLCQGDISTVTCKNCVSLAAQGIVARCPIEKEAIIWYDLCFLRYSNRSFFSSMEIDPMLYLANEQNISDPTSFGVLMAKTMNDGAVEASTAPPGAKKISVKEANLTGFQPTLYTLMQCTGDLSNSDCLQCLLIIIAYMPSYCGGKQGGRLMSPSCYARFEVYSFYNATAVQRKPPPRPPSPELPPPPPPLTSGTTLHAREKGGISTVTIVVIVASIIASIVLFCLGFCFLRRRARKKHEAGSEIATVESLQMDLNTIENATNNFSADNKLGEGGFGEVYKGTLPNGQEIAIKKLSKSSVQGSEEFKNEVVLLAKLQHRNLVRLLGFCLEGIEKILIYEFVPNKSLNYFLFDLEKQAQLDWPRRYQIIKGISRGILYLHEDSRLKIIHRDLKASNILLDGDMNPKIADFGMARIFRVDQTQENTNKIVGTYGYMAPEYAMQGQFSIKSDMYSFGVLVLEIICGKNNTSFYQTDGAEDLVNFVWKHWRDETPLEVLDPCLRDSHLRNEVLRCIQIGLLCVQEDPADRPTMAAVVLMLNSFSVTLPMPQQPGFYLYSKSEPTMLMRGLEFDESATKSVQLSVDRELITEVHPR